MMIYIESIILKKKRWKLNRHRFGNLGNEFPSDLVAVGNFSYVKLKVSSFSKVDKSC
ncbi:hypothetical protein ABFV50_11020 [Bacillus cereus]